MITLFLSTLGMLSSVHKIVQNHVLQILMSGQWGEWGVKEHSSKKKSSHPVLLKSTLVIGKLVKISFKCFYKVSERWQR